jgi:hypothetical protein
MSAPQTKEELRARIIQSVVGAQTDAEVARRAAAEALRSAQAFMDMRAPDNTGAYGRGFNAAMEACNDIIERTLADLGLLKS